MKPTDKDIKMASVTMTHMFKMVEQNIIIIKRKAKDIRKACMEL